MSILMTWPLARSAGYHILGAIYDWDAYTNTMIMGSRVDAALGRGPLSLYDNYFFAPLPDTIVYNENLFGLSLIFAPLYLSTGNPLWAYNVTLLSSLALSVFFTYLLVRRLTGSGLAGILAGVAFAFSPYALFEIGRIQLVATQWIPACFLMLHRAIEERRLRDVIGLWLCYLLQIGTSLYYAMFLVPLLAVAGAVLLVRHRPSRQLYVQLAAVGAVAGGIALLMVYPYLTARDTFSLERSLAFASSYDGKLSFFGNVHETNRTLTGMHHQAELRGAHEEIAFPGFTVLGLLLLALGVPLGCSIQQLGWRRIAATTWRWAAVFALTFTVSVLTGSMLFGAFVFALGAWLEVRQAQALPFSGQRGLYLALLLLAVVMFLGLQPMTYEGEPVRGLYYYFHTYFPGFNGIRKVSRQAVMTTFITAIVASFGAAWLFSKVSRPWAKGVVLAGLLALSTYELRSFPHPLRAVWAGPTVPEAYRFMATLPEDDLVVGLPQNSGARLFRGDHGLTLHNYLMLYHKHRSLNGQSSWEPPVTELVNLALLHLPDEGARRILQSLEARHLVVHAWALEAHRQRLPEELMRQPEHYRRIFQRGGDSVFTLAAPKDPSLELASTPQLPAASKAIPGRELRALSNLDGRWASHAIDGNLDTAWSGRLAQAPGQYFELALERPQPIIAFEIENPQTLTHLPMSFELSTALGGSGWQTVAQQPKLRVYRDFVFSPKTFVFRIVLPAPVVADRLRLTLGQPVPGRPMTIHEARVYAAE